MRFFGRLFALLHAPLESPRDFDKELRTELRTAELERKVEAIESNPRLQHEIRTRYFEVIRDSLFRDREI